MDDEALHGKTEKQLEYITDKLSKLFKDNKGLKIKTGEV